MMRTLSKQRRSALRAIGPGLLLVIAGSLPGAIVASKNAHAAQQICEIPYVCERDTNRNGGQTAAGTSSDSTSGGTSSSPTGDTSSSPTSDTSSAPTGD
jgi:hypothetical protein